MGAMVPGCSLSPRLEGRDVVRERAPPPGAYSLPGSMNDGLVFSFAKSVNKVPQAALSTPGPGSYTAVQRKRGGFSLGAKWKAQRSIDTPGPGAYDGDSMTMGKAKGRITMKVCIIVFFFIFLLQSTE